MKKLLILTLLLATATLSQAQVFDSIYVNGPEHYTFEIRNIMTTRNGDLVANINIFGDDGDVDLGNRLTKLSFLNGHLQVEDTVFVEDNDIWYYLMEKDPFGDGNIYAEIVRDFDSCRSYLRVAFFDDDLSFDYKREFRLLLEDTIVNGWGLFTLDPYGDIILRYNISGDAQSRFLRVGLDGTLKLKRVVPISELDMTEKWGLKTLGTHPLEYVLFGINHHNRSFEHRSFILDSSFQVAGCISFDEDNFLYPTCYDRTIGTNDGNLIIATSFLTTDYAPVITRKHGAMVGRFDRDGNLLDTVVFHTNPYITGPGGVNFGIAHPIDVAWAPDGNIYYAYNTQAWYEVRVSVVKLDRDLNVIWQRYCLQPETQLGTVMEVLDDGVAVGGWTIPGVFILALSDDGVSVPEMEAYVRPYAFYPNPVGDILHMEFSPDVTPVQVELYDLQGRLLRTQNNGFESIDMDNLPTGTYTLRVTLDDGMSYGDKVVKQ